MPLITNLSPRYDIPIKNRYEMINNSKDDFHIAIYYIDSNKCKIINRRIDDSNGWGTDIKIRFKDSSNETISIGSSYYNSKILYIYTKTLLTPVKYKLQKIPKLIFQTTSNKDINDILFYSSILTFIELNPEYEYKILDDIECQTFIKDNFDKDIQLAYNMLIPGAFKADLFRYCYLYINGGCYFDCKHISRIPLRSIIKKDDYLLLCNDIGIGYYNAVMMAEKMNKNILSVIKSCKNKIFNFFNHYNFKDKNINKAESILSLTGPIHLYNELNNIINHEDVLRFKHKNKKHNHAYQSLIVEYNNSIFITKQYASYNGNGGSHYSELWYKREIIYINVVIKTDYIFYVYPTNYKDIYNFYIFNECTLIIERQDSDSGWGNNLRIKINNTKLDIGSSTSKYKIIDLPNFFKIDNYILSYSNKNTEHQDIFSINIITSNDKKNIIVVRRDQPIGWGQNLIINIKLIDGTENDVIIGRSDYQVKIVDF